MAGVGYDAFTALVINLGLLTWFCLGGRPGAGSGQALHRMERSAQSPAFRSPEGNGREIPKTALIFLHKKKAFNRLVKGFFVVAEAGFEPTTFGL